ncbi:MAG TPA: PIG-L family deacetylase [Bryobacteraceae bacterium]|nr:PIG-L family deacetylase [Bryobacteraceae bacterium]
MQRRDFLTGLLAGGAILRLKPAWAQQGASGVFVERLVAGTPHKGKVLAAIQPHSDDISEFAAGTVAKLIQEGYKGYMIRATNDDMGDDIGDPGSIGENVLRNERENADVTRALGLERSFDLNYNNHRMGDVSWNELICRLIFLFRLLKVNTIFCYDPWRPDEENPDHYVLARCVEAACWMAGRVHDYSEQFAAGLEPHAVTEKYYYARRPEITRVVDITNFVEKKVDANLANQAKGPGGHHGSRLRSELAKKNERLPLLGDNGTAADRNYIKEFVLHGDRELGKKYGVEYAEAFHYIGPPQSREAEYIREHLERLR